MAWAARRRRLEEASRLLRDVYEQTTVRPPKASVPAPALRKPSRVATAPNAPRTRKAPPASATGPWAVRPVAHSAVFDAEADAVAPLPLPSVDDELEAAPPSSSKAAADRVHCLELVDQYAKLRDECLQKAGREYQAGRGQVAAVYSQDARRSSEWMKQELARAVDLAVEHRFGCVAGWGDGRRRRLLTPPRSRSARTGGGRPRRTQSSDTGRRGARRPAWPPRQRGARGGRRRDRVVESQWSECVGADRQPNVECAWRWRDEPAPDMRAAPRPPRTGIVPWPTRSAPAGDHHGSRTA